MEGNEKHLVKVYLTQSDANSILKFIDRAHFDTYLSLAENKNEAEAYEMRNAFAHIASSINADFPQEG